MEKVAAKGLLAPTFLSAKEAEFRARVTTSEPRGAMVAPVTVAEVVASYTRDWAAAPVTTREAGVMEVVVVALEVLRL